MCAEVAGRHLERLLPARDALGERPVDVLEGLFSRGVAGLSNTVEDAAGDGLLLGLITEEGVFERDVLVGRVEAHRFAELLQRGIVGADFE